MIDSHCHLGFGSENVAELLMRAKEKNVTQILTVACAVDDYSRLIELLDQYPEFYGAFGIHPEYADKLPLKEDIIKKLQLHPKIVAVGECGLDYHYAPNTKEKQRQLFEMQIEIAHQLQKPIIVHTREADEDTISILESANRVGLLSFGGVLHCFTGTQVLADKALEWGFYLSASGIITFKSAENLRFIFQSIPLCRLLIETDAPYLAPLPFRGQENESAFMVKTAEKLAEIKQISLSELDKITTQNFKRLFIGGEYES